MPGSTQSVQPRLIVIPRQLEGFFYERLTQQFAGRDDLRVVVDRRPGAVQRAAPRRTSRRRRRVVAARHAVLRFLS
jgi:hypothetical protein